MTKETFFEEFDEELQENENAATATTTCNVVPIQKAKTISIGTVIKKLKNIENEINENLIERDEIIRDCMLALVSKNHIFLYGPPGTAKSLLVKEFKKRIECRNYFQMLLNKTTDVSEIFGPISIPAMEKDIVKRITKNKFPEAEIVFLDEIFKCNTPILNALLTALNERIFYNDVVMDIPLLTMFCASNEIPFEDELMALYDRIMFRENVEYVKDTQNRVNMYKNFINKPESTPKNIISLEEIKLLQEMTSRIIVPDKIYTDFELIMHNLYKEYGISISDRRKNACFKVLQASALLNNRRHVIGDDFECLVNVLWNQPNEVDNIRKELIKMVNPYKNEFNGYIEKFTELKERIESAENSRDRDQMVIESKAPLEKLLTKMNNTINNASNDGRDVSEMLAKRNEITDTVRKLIESSLGLNIPLDTKQGTDKAVNIENPSEYIKNNLLDFDSEVSGIDIPF